MGRQNKKEETVMDSLETVFKERKSTKTKLVGFFDTFKQQFPRQMVFVATMVIVVVFLFLNFTNVIAFFNKIISVLTPVWIGMILTYLMAPLYDIIIDLPNENKANKYVKKYENWLRPLATIICTLVVVLVTIGLIFLFVPQLYDSITKFLSKADIYVKNIQNYIEGLRSNVKDDATKAVLKQVLGAINDAINQSGDLFKIDVPKIFAGVYNGVYVSLKVVINAFVGLMVMIYLLNMKTDLLNSCKRIMFALFKNDIAKKLLVEVRYTHKVFSGFLVGKILDSLIIGVICYICCSIMSMPYTPLVSVIVGITNIIPFFGPFIGAIPSFVLIVLESPIKGVIFAIFILILQQIDGNIIGPKILGDRTGVGSFWVLFSILLFGGLFGFLGMIIAVPVWAVITRFFEIFILNKLKEKGQPLTVEDYQRLKVYDEELKKVSVGEKD